MRAFVTLTLGILLLASGTARAQGVVLSLPPDDQQKITTVLGQGVVGVALPSNPIGILPSSFHLAKGRRPTRSRPARTPGTRKLLASRRRGVQAATQPGGFCSRPRWPVSSVRRRGAILLCRL